MNLLQVFLLLLIACRSWICILCRFLYGCAASGCRLLVDPTDSSGYDSLLENLSVQFLCGITTMYLQMGTLSNGFSICRMHTTLGVAVFAGCCGCETHQRYCSSSLRQPWLSTKGHATTILTQRSPYDKQMCWSMFALQAQLVHHTCTMHICKRSKYGHRATSRSLYV